MGVLVDEPGTTVEIRLPRRGMVIIAGLPGAGKSTLLAGITETAGAIVLDSDQVRLVLAGRLPAAVPYRTYRPLVHVLHRLRILYFCAITRRPVLAHEPATRASTRALLVLIAAVTGRGPYLLWLDTTPDQAAMGQRERGRMLGSRSFSRHLRRAGRVRRRLDAGRGLRGWVSVDVLPRPPLGTPVVLRPLH
ncbi:AAA family ATPase [Amycolatopsis suaedae]|uniref:Zeta toxin n=1 Tax=Amycolatopsis suaedae TaxID=2510978 RepID=A0A4Q7J6R7_9PSEU|nr:AAA family ATPase [Amycolatopsis suaedae]RZQ61704.1 Zeta toxin [Amycolatopsis suaedae]